MLVEGDDELVGGVWREKENDCVFGSKQMNLIFSVNDGVLAVIGSVCLFSGKTNNVFRGTASI